MMTHEINFNSALGNDLYLPSWASPGATRWGLLLSVIGPIPIVISAPSLRNVGVEGQTVLSFPA